MVTLSTFLQFWGVVFLATTGFVCFFKPEVESGVNDKILGLVDTYKQVIRGEILGVDYGAIPTPSAQYSSTARVFTCKAPKK